MKKTVIISLVILLCFSLVGCRKQQKNTEQNDTQQEYNITDWFNNDEMEQCADDGSEDALDSDGVVLPDHIW